MPALAELTGGKGRFAARADWAEQAADLVLAYPVERDSQFMLREGSTLARGALLSRAAYAIPALDIPVTNTSVRGPAMAWLLAEEDFASAAQVLDRGIGTLNVTASWTPIACCGRTSDRARCPGSPSSPSPPIWDPPGFSSRTDSGQQALRSSSLSAPSSPTVPDLGTTGS
jgi:hypothetical protein